ERLDLPDVGDHQPVLFHVLDMLGPEIDKGHVLAGLDHVRPGVAADRSGADHRNLLPRRHYASSVCAGTAAYIPRPILVRGHAEGEAVAAQMRVSCACGAARARRCGPAACGGPAAAAICRVAWRACRGG